MGDPKTASLLSMPPGCRFYPSEEQLLCYYLSNKNKDNNTTDPAGVQSDNGGYDLIRELDLYGHDPFDLPETVCYSYGHGGRKRHWFCYTVRVLKERRAKSGYWRRKGRVRDVVGGGKAVVGRRSSFVFYLGNSPNTAVRTDWVLYQYAQLDHVKASCVLCRVFVRSRGGNRISDYGLSSCNEESACTVRHIGIQHDGFRTPSNVGNDVHGDNSVPGKNEMSKYPIRLDREIDDRVMTAPVSVSRIQHNGQVPSSVFRGSTPIFLDDLAPRHILSIIEGDYIELDDLFD